MMNTNQSYFNTHFAARAPHGRIIVNSGLIVAIVLGLSVADVSQRGIMNLGWREIILSHPVFIGDTLYTESLIVASLGLSPGLSFCHSLYEKRYEKSAFSWDNWACLRS
jgi:acyl dehydratase